MIPFRIVLQFICAVQKIVGYFHGAPLRDCLVFGNGSTFPLPRGQAVTAHQAYATPLGNILVDGEALQALQAQLRADNLHLVLTKNDPEHSMEIELPFLQRVLKSGFKLLPVMVREPSKTVTQALGKALAKILKGRQALLVASTDLSHFYPQETARTLDAEFLRCVEAFDPDLVLQIEEQGKGFACGRGAVVAVLWAAKELGADQVKVLHHATSGDV